MILTVTLNASVDKLYLIENMTPNTVMRVKKCYNTAGGKGLNVSRVAALTGEEVIATGFLGGHSGDFIKSMLIEDNVRSQFVEIKEETRTCINIFDIETEKQTELLEPGAQVTKSDLNNFIDTYQKLLDDCDVVTISGSLPKGVSTDFYSLLVDSAKKKSKKIILDTSGEALKNSIYSKPTMIKPNIDEIKQLFNLSDISADNIIKCGKELYNSGIKIVVISMGKHGSLIVCSDGVYKCNAPEVKAVNTVGCGDSMVAGFAVGLSKKYSMIDSIRLAAAVSAANACCIKTGSFNKQDLDRLLPLIKIKQIETFK